MTHDMTPVSFDPLPPDLQAALAVASGRLGGFGNLSFVAETGSTNDIAFRLALDGALEGASVLADVQLAGRGRRGNVWASPAGAGIYLSIVTRPSRPAGEVPLITLAAGVAAARAITAVTKLPLELKWPNDIVTGRPWRKLGGILTEATGTGERLDAVVIGIGINVLRASYPAEVAGAATSIETELGRPVDRTPLIVELLACVGEEVRHLHAGHRLRIRESWRAFGGAGLAGARVAWMDAGTRRQGRAHDIDEDGALLVNVHGTLERVMGGEVRWEGLSRE